MSKNLAEVKEIMMNTPIFTHFFTNVQYIGFDSAIVGVPVEFRLDEGDEPTVTLHGQPSFTFTNVKPTEEATMTSQ